MTPTRIRDVLVLFTALFLAACGDVSDPLAPAVPEAGSDGTQGPPPTPPVAVLQQAMDSAGGMIRIEVELRSDVLPLRAREVELQDSSQVRDEEKIISRIAGIEAGPDGGVLRLSLEGPEVRYTPSTRFEDEDDKRSMESWVGQVQERLARGEELWVEARRRAPGQAADPSSGTFDAIRLELDDEDEHEIKVNVTRAHLTRAGEDGILRILGMEISLEGAQGGTRILTPGDTTSQAREFEAGVTAADPAAGTFTLSGGSVGRMTSSTTIEADGDLFTLESVAAAVATGRPIRAEGRWSAPDAAGVRTVLRVKFEDDS